MQVQAARIPWVEVAPGEAYASPTPASVYRLHEPSLTVWRETETPTTARELQRRLAKPDTSSAEPTVEQVLAQVQALHRLGLICSVQT